MMQRIVQVMLLALMVTITLIVPALAQNFGNVKPGSVIGNPSTTTAPAIPMTVAQTWEAIGSAVNITGGIIALDGGVAGATKVAVGNATGGGYQPNNPALPVEMLVSTTGAANGIIGQTVNNVPYATKAFLPVGTTGYGKVPSGTASVAFGLYGLGEIFNPLGEAVGGEVTVRNFGGSAASDGRPPPTGSPTSNLIADGFHITCGSQGVGENDCSTGLLVSNESGGSSVSQASFANGIFVNGYREFGLYIAAGYPTGTQETAELDNNGNGINLQLHTTGSATPANAVFTITNSLGLVQAAMFQNGDLHANTVTGVSYFVGATAGVTCSGSPTSSFASIGGLVTHC